MVTNFKLLFDIKKTEVKADSIYSIMGRISIGKTMVQFSTKQIVTNTIHGQTVCLGKVQ
ncbi:hypothetical protein [Coprobacter sp.]|uniref:hypothetical protein n=1 Tax=Coprobacter sp. TaxID=1941478 RepID=UPI0025DEDB78|nr:hypothetical protein [uncultured Coprobacter sp.]